MPNMQDQRGRSKTTGHYVRLQTFMLKTLAWQELRANARVIYVELASRYYGSNNGRITLSARDAARLCHLNKNTVTRAFRQLVDHGFIECVTSGGFSRKVRHATEWRLTEHRCDVTKALPTKAFMRWRPQKQNTAPKEGHTGPHLGPQA